MSPPRVARVERRWRMVEVRHLRAEARRPAARGSAQCSDRPRRLLPRSARVGLLACIGLVLAAPAQGQSSGRLRHEYVSPDVLARITAGRVEAAIVEDGDPLPEAVRRDGARLPAPPTGGPPPPMMRNPDEAPPSDSPGIYRPDQAFPDRRTGADSDLKYHAIYNPTVAPLRRNVAFDRVEADYRLTVAASPRERVNLSPRQPVPGREMFWGDLAVEFHGEDEPLPSVAPDMRILAVRTTPSVPVRFYRDAADNFYVRANHRGEVRLSFLVDADQTYFSGPVPGNVLLDHQRGQAGTELPRRAAEAGRRVLGQLGIDPRQPFDQGLDALIRHFRAFTAGPPPDSTADIYVDLALGGVGVCRHRSFAFMITARAAGVPTRVIHNEAHAFVEVRAPDGKWRRIDLGGEAPELSIDGGDGRRLHTPTPDPFPKPDPYLSQYSSMLTHGAPPSDGGPEGADLPNIEGAPPGLGPGSGDEPAPGSDGGGGEGSGLDGAGLDGAGGNTDGADRAGPGEAGPAGPTSDPSGRFTDVEDIPAEVPLPTPPGMEEGLVEAGATLGAPVSVRLAMDAAAPLPAYRGEALPEVVSGKVSSIAGGEGLSGVKVQLYLIPDSGGVPVPVGAAVITGADGRFETRLRLPATLGLGDYRLVAASAESEGWSAGRSDVQ